MEAIRRDMEPMLAASGAGMPEGEQWEYEPKWDGFRTVVHCSAAGVTLVSRGARDMTRYFPEMVEPLRRLGGAAGCVLDGELVVVTAAGLDFDALGQRIHPAESRVRMLSERTPARYVAFDLLADGDQDLRRLPLGERRSRLEARLNGVAPPVHVTPYTRDRAVAMEWFEVFEGAGLDGVIAKRWDEPYVPGKRLWVKVKHERTADCVVIGWRWANDGSSLGAVLLGLHDSEGRLHYVGHTSAFSAAAKREVLARLEPLRQEAEPEMGRRPGGPSRWSRGRAEAGWEMVRPELVCEVAYDKLQGGERFRHASRFLRWRPDKPAAECRFDQLESVAAFDVAAIFG